MDRIRVLQIVTRLAVRGVPRHVLDLAANLDSARFDVEVLAGRSEPGEGELWEEAKRRGIRAWYIPELQRPVRPLADLIAFSRIYRRIRKGRYDIVHTHISKAGILGRLAARLAGVPVVLHTYHGQVDELRGDAWGSRFFRMCERRAARWSSGLIVVSWETVQRYLDFGIGQDGQFHVVHNGIDVRQFVNFDKGTRGEEKCSGDPLIGTICSLTHEKGIDNLITVMPDLVERFPGIRLCIIGGGPQAEHLSDLARQLGVEAQVVFPGIVEDVREWLAEFDLFVLPSLHEGLPTALLEAMAMGCPVVASRVGGIPEIVIEGECGLLVEPGDVEGMVRAIDGLLRDAQKQREIGGNGQRRIVEHFSLERMVEELAGIYELLIAEKRRRS